MLFSGHNSAVIGKKLKKIQHFKIDFLPIMIFHGIPSERTNISSVSLIGFSKKPWGIFR